MKNSIAKTSQTLKKNKETIKFFSLIDYLYKLIAIIFLVSALFTFVVTLSKPFESRAVVFFLYIILDSLFIYGFWKKRKWVLVLLNLTIFLLLLSSLVKILFFQQKITPALIVTFLLLGAIDAFGYFTRAHLNGKYKHFKALRIFLIVLILAQFLEKYL